MKKFALLSISLMCTLIVFDALLNPAWTRSTGAPGGHTGNPSDNGGNTCTECHTGSSATPVTGWIT
ncbi:MAG: hypothetical protein KDD36_04765 [Flavobacteriales bacterium]|nr:hypothetical protein [Flavobacteriales bacterium]